HGVRCRERRPGNFRSRRSESSIRPRWRAGEQPVPPSTSIRGATSRAAPSEDLSMRRTSVVLSAAVLLLGASAAFAQPANFAGHWAQEVLAGNRDGGPGGGGGFGGPGGPGGGGRGNPQGAGTFGNDFVAV